jgi:hypothetical protein
MSKNGSKFSLDFPLKVNLQNVFKKFFLLSSALFLRSLTRIRIRIWDPHLECGSRMRIQETKIMRIHADADADADPQHWLQDISGIYPEDVNVGDPLSFTWYSCSLRPCWSLPGGF